jgi:uncharacterized membrane protein
MDQRKRFYVALAIYAALALLIWTTMSDVPVPISSFSISFRRLTLGILALFVVRTVLHWRAEEIRAQRQKQDELSS